MPNLEKNNPRPTPPPPDQPGIHLGPWLPQVEAALADFNRRQVIPRIWGSDHTVWKPDPTEISNRLGWLASTDEMRQQAPALASFADEVRRAGFRHVVLLGMGGSSLGPEVLRQAFGSAPGYPELLVLDSTVPAWVLSVAQAVDPSRTLFLVSSKSGSTAEPNLLYAYFRDLVEKAVGAGNAGNHFIAITDPGSPLETLAHEADFRRVFLNSTDIGGRFSVLSYFGLVPAALSGLDLSNLLDRADAMRDATGPSVPPRLNPAAWLGLAMAVLARQGRDKLTLVASPVHRRLRTVGRAANRRKYGQRAPGHRSRRRRTPRPVCGPSRKLRQRPAVRLLAPGWRRQPRLRRSRAGRPSGGAACHSSGPSRQVRPGRRVLPLGTGHCCSRFVSGNQPIRPAQRPAGQGHDRESPGPVRRYGTSSGHGGFQFPGPTTGRLRPGRLLGSHGLPAPDTRSRPGPGRPAPQDNQQVRYCRHPRLRPPGSSTPPANSTREAPVRASSCSLPPTTTRTLLSQGPTTPSAWLPTPRPRGILRHC